MKRQLALLLCLCMLSSAALGEGITTPTDLGTAAPTAEPTASPEPTPEPTAEPTATPEPTPEPTVEPTATPEPWDESLCDHANEQCVQAPACDAAGCWHIGQDANGLDVPLCPKGQWLLDQQDALQRSGALPKARTVRNSTIDLNLADAVIYRSGTYKVTGGGAASRLTIASNRLVVLDMTAVTADSLTMQDNVQLTLRLAQQNTLEKLILGRQADVRITEGGALTIAAAERPQDDPGSIRITGGSVQAPLQEAQGRSMTVFRAQGMTAVTVDGQPYPANCPHADGSACLWLVPAAEGKKWTAVLNGAVLEISQADDVQEPQHTGIIQGQENLLAPGAHELSGQVADGTRLLIRESGATLILTDAAAGALIDASAPYTLYTKGITSLGDVPGQAEVFAEGRLTLAALTGSVTWHGGVIVLPQPPAGWQLTDVPAAAQSVTLDGVPIPCITDASGLLCLPAPADGATYAIAVTDSTITVQTQLSREKHFVLTADAPLADAADALHFTVTGVGSSITASSATATADFADAQILAAGPALSLNGEHLTVSLTGDNALRSGGQAIALAGDSSLALKVLSGRLVLNQTDLTGVTLTGNIRLEPESQAPHLHLVIRDGAGQPVPDTPLTLLIGDTRYEYTTHADGSLHLWGLGDLSGQAIAASSGEYVYTAVVAGDEATATTGLNISGVTAAQQGENVVVTFTCEGAAAAGAQVYLSDAALDMADTFLPDAQHIAAENGQVTIPVTPGQTVSLRVYASGTAGAALTADTADGFQFSELIHLTTRRQWSHTESIGWFYTGKPYRPRLELPEGAQVRYSGPDLNDHGQPWQVGKYTMHVTIPEGHAQWLPGTVDLPFEIWRVNVFIQPAPNQEKYQGTEDPVFAYTVRGLLEGDTVEGALTRQPGEDPGNYAFTLDGLTAADHYRLRLEEDAPGFTILPKLSAGGGGAYEVLRPVRQEITRADGRSLHLMMTTKDTLDIRWSSFGKVLFSTDDNKNRPFTPSLTWNEETDAVLLRIRSEAELNKDGGYATDGMGEPLWTGRSLRTGTNALRHMQQIGLDAISLSHKNVAVTLPIASLLDEHMEALVKEHNGSMSNVKFYLNITPARPDPAVAPVTDSWHVAVLMVIGKTETDITAHIPGLMVSLDMEPLADILSAMALYDESAFPSSFTLTINGQPSATSAFIEPFTPEETALTPYPCLMYTSRYLLSNLDASGVVCVVKAGE